ncbi:MAG: penicillin acylase family protein [Acidobacteriota bacterium]
MARPQPVATGESWGLHAIRVLEKKKDFTLDSGESGDPSSPHFSDQAQRYATGDLREV